MTQTAPNDAPQGAQATPTATPEPTEVQDPEKGTARVRKPKGPPTLKKLLADLRARMAVDGIEGLTIEVGKPARVTKRILQTIDLDV